MKQELTGKGQCICGAITYQTFSPLRDSISCHCQSCRRWSGHYVSATACLTVDVLIEGDSHLSWYSVTDDAKRGFCSICGSSLFWQHKNRDSMSICSGTLDTPTHIKEMKHIYLEEKSDYYKVPI